MHRALGLEKSQSLRWLYWPKTQVWKEPVLSPGGTRLGGSEMHLMPGHRNLRAEQLLPLARLYQLQPHQQN